MGLVMLDDGYLGIRKLLAESKMKVRFRPARERPHYGDTLYFGARRIGEAQALIDGSLGHLARAEGARHLILLDGRSKLTVLEDRASRVVQESANSEDRHWINSI